MPQIRLTAEEILRAAPLEANRGVEVGRSRQGRPIRAFTCGEGPVRVSLIGGCHADEPVGPELLDRLTGWLSRRPPSDPLTRAVTWSIVPRVNPDGDRANESWARPFPPLDGGYPLSSYLSRAVREPPGEDVEFGFPRHPDDHEARPENRAVANFLARQAPFHLHATLHGMAFAAGPWFLLEQAWIERSAEMRDALRRRLAALGYRPHDVDRGGEKGFFRIDLGFTTRPDSRAMQAFFEGRGEPETAALFRPSSMETVRALGGDPLTMVSEMPLFVYDPDRVSEPGAPPLPTEPTASRAFVAWAMERLAADGGDSLDREALRFGIAPMPVGDQMRLQLALIEEGIEAVTAG